MEYVAGAGREETIRPALTVLRTALALPARDR